MRSQALINLLAGCQSNPTLKQAIKSCRSLNELVATAQDAGYPITARELQLWANAADFNASFWPWSGWSATEKLAFFRGQRNHP